MWEQKVHLWDIFSPPHARILLFLAAGAFLGARKVPFRTSHIIHIMNSVTCWSALWNFTWRAHVVRILRESLGNKLTLCGDANECLCATQISPSSASTIRSILATRLLTEKSLRRAIIMRADFGNGSECCSLGAKYLSRKCALESYGTFEWVKCAPIDHLLNLHNSIFHFTV
jgi:hypothetical protein